MENINENLKQDDNSALHKANVSGSVSYKKNPYKLIWYKQGWSRSKIEQNNAKYWQFEIEHNGLRLP